MIRRWTLIAVLLASGACSDDGSEVETGGDTAVGGDTALGDTADDAAEDVADSQPLDDADADAADAPDTVADVTEPDAVDADTLDDVADVPADTDAPDSDAADTTTADTGEADAVDTAADSAADTVADTVTDTADAIDTMTDTADAADTSTDTSDAADTTVADSDAAEADAPCVQEDFEPNDGENTAHGLPSVECATPVTGRLGTLVAGDTDWFRFDRADGFCLDAETVQVTADVALQVCAYVACEGVSAPAEFDCVVGTAATSPLGRTGCCGAGRVDFAWNCEGGFTTADDITVWFSVTSDEAACSEYSISYGE